MNKIPRRQSIPSNDLTKPKNRILRWNLLWLILVLGLVLGIGLAPLWMDLAFGCQGSWNITATIFMIMDAIFWVSAILVWTSLLAEWKEFRETPNDLRFLPAAPKLSPTGQIISKDAKDAVPASKDPEAGSMPKITHVALMTGYKEPVDLISSTLDTVAAQTVAGNIILVIGLEERTPEYESKIAYLCHRYQHCFFKVIPTVHPHGIEGEIAGACSNANWAIRQCTTLLRDQGTPLDPETTILTKFDTDTLFLPTHFEVLEREFLALPKEDRLQTMFQSALVYNLALDERWFFARVTGILRTFFMLGFLIPYNINTMSIYSMSLDLARKAKYWLPNYQMEDIIMNLNLMCGCGKRVPIHFLPLPTVSGPTSGETFVEEFEEWRLQARRWTIGAAEVFHYYMIKMLGGAFDIWSGIGYGASLTLYYGFVLCVIGLYQFCVSVAVNLDGCHAFHAGTASDAASTRYPFAHPTELFIALLVLKYVWVFGTAFLADLLHKRILGVEEKALRGFWGWTRNLLHFLSSPIVLLGYSVVEAMALIEMCYRGRDICGHDPSKKTSLVASTNRDGTTETVIEEQDCTITSLVASIHGDGTTETVIEEQDCTNVATAEVKDHD